MDCMTNNTEYVEDFGRVQTKQEEINSLYAGKYRAALKKSKVSKVMYEIALVDNEIDELDNSIDYDKVTAKEKKTIVSKVEKLAAKKEKLEKEYNKLSTEEGEISIMESANDIMILGSLVGNFIESGYIKKDGKNIDPTLEIVQGFTQKTKAKLLENAIKLYTVDDAESGN